MNDVVATGVSIARTAQISECRQYRWTLSRTWDESLPVVVFVSLNPSKADGEIDDATIRKDVGFAQRWGYGGLVKVNLFAFRETNPAELARICATGTDVIGSENDATIQRECADRDVVVAWGDSLPMGMRGRARRVLELIRPIARTVDCLGYTGKGNPKHPLYIPYETPRRRYV